jgi:hypothetical protein
MYENRLFSTRVGQSNSPHPPILRCVPSQRITARSSDPVGQGRPDTIRFEGQRPGGNLLNSIPYI